MSYVLSCIKKDNENKERKKTHSEMVQEKVPIPRAESSTSLCCCMYFCIKVQTIKNVTRTCSTIHPILKNKLSKKPSESCNTYSFNNLKNNVNKKIKEVSMSRKKTKFSFLLTFLNSSKEPNTALKIHSLTLIHFPILFLKIQIGQAKD